MASDSNIPQTPPSILLPPPTVPGEILLKFDRWATDGLLDACSSLSEQQLDQEFEMGLGTLRKTLTHMLGAMRGWTDVLTEADPPRPRIEHDPKRSIDELRELHNQVFEEFIQGVHAGAHDDILSRTREGKTYTFSRGGVLTHVTTHAMHHRAQCLNMLRQLGVKPLPKSSVMEWMIEHPLRS